MTVDLYVRWITEVFDEKTAIGGTVKFRNSDDTVTVELKVISEDDIKKLEEVVSKRKAHLGRGTWNRAERDAVDSFERRLSTWRKMSKMGDDDAYKPTTLRELEAALVKVVGDLKHKWLFVEQDDEELCPMFISAISYIGADRYSPAHVTIKMKATLRGEEQDTQVSFYHEALLEKVETNEFEFDGGEDEEDFEMEEEDEKKKPAKPTKKDVKVKATKTVAKILGARGLYLESDWLVEQYMEEIKKYRELAPKVGLQMLAKGIGSIIPEEKEGNGWYSWWYGDDKELAMVRDGRPTRVVLDNQAGAKTGGENFRKRDRWGGDKKKSDGTTSSGFWKANTTVALPLMPYVQVFDLDKHKWVSLHVVNLDPYPWDNTMGEKLVLPLDARELVDMLLDGAGEMMDDIVKGKTGGVIVISTGEPGTGKTLTAEVYSEVLEKPLYVVQCSQLGTDEEELEKKLSTILSRAQRWGAILLMDEADVYIRTRGGDIQQNAIVGVFLRLLEYYKGVLFMTSNKTMEIDDAILSRATAWLKYDLPDEADLRRIWEVLSTQFKNPLDTSMIDGLVEAFPPGSISGRNVKNLLKLAIWRSKKKESTLDVKTFQWVSKFQDIDSTLIETMNATAAKHTKKK